MSDHMIVCGGDRCEETFGPMSDKQRMFERAEEEGWLLLESDPLCPSCKRDWIARRADQIKLRM